MKTLGHARTWLLLSLVLALLQPLRGHAQPGPPRPRDGQHDFDFEFGRWKTHVSRLQHPLSGSTTWLEYDGTSVVRKIWKGAANVVELDASGAAGRIEALSLRLYNPQSRQWSLSYASRSGGPLSVPAIGEFKNGRGEFFDQETFNGRAILVRNTWSDITADSARFEQAFSDDGGKTWEVNWIATDTRMEEQPVRTEAAKAKEDPGRTKAGASQDGRYDFDFEIGTWDLHLRRLVHPLTNSDQWVDFYATSVTRKVWEGRANLEEFDADDPVGHNHIDGLTLRLYDPQSRQWSIYWANRAKGTMDQPMLGEFKNGVGEFYDQEPFNGRAIYVRYIWSNTSSDVPHFVQSYSTDGGKTWEPNWITDQTRKK